MIDKMKCTVLAEELRAHFNVNNLAPIDVFALSRTVPHLSTVLFPFGQAISGLCIKNERYSLVAINSTQTYGRQRFTLAHELYHLYFDKQSGTIICPSDSSRASNIEREADSFASFFLLPRLALKNELVIHGISKDTPMNDGLLKGIFEIEQKYEISRGALLVRLEDEEAITPQQKTWLSSDIKRNARRLGFSTSLYERRQGSDAKKADGYYLDLISDLLANNVISRGKAKELLSDGFRDDIHVIELEGDDILD
ncbi:MAG: ImmA/IrrE family metallo-endopeptidase [Eggerthellaceae bacterium]